MSTCWKCQRVLPEGQVECEPFCSSAPINDDKSAGWSAKEIVEMIHDEMRESAPLDPDKIKTFEDLKEVLLIIWTAGGQRFNPKYFPGIAKYLKPLGTPNSIPPDSSTTDKHG